MAESGTSSDRGSGVKAVAEMPRTQLLRRKLLYLGAGTDRTNPAPHVFPDFEIVANDIDPNTRPDVLMDMTTLTELPAESFDGVVSNHSLEHVFPHQVAQVLDGVRHVLTRAGKVVIRVPDLQKAARLLADHDFNAVVYHSPAGPIYALDMIYGFRPAIAAGQTYMAHKTGFTPKSLRAALEEAGFVRVEIDTGTITSVDLTAVAMRP